MRWMNILRNNWISNERYNIFMFHRSFNIHPSSAKPNFRL